MAMSLGGVVIERRNVVARSKKRRRTAAVSKTVSVKVIDLSAEGEAVACEAAKTALTVSRVQPCN
jgi:hypothetical protein